jgi:hypothetical protein
VTISIIGILAGLTFGALQMARGTAREAATKATIAKLDSIIMRRYESYMNRRVPISTSGFPPRVAAQYRLFALRDLMRMEMPERPADAAGSTAYPDTSAADQPANVATEITQAIISSWSWPADRTFYSPGQSLPGGGADIDNWTVTLSSGSFVKVRRKLPAPATAQICWTSVHARPGDADGTNGPAEMLYRLVSIGSPEAMEQFNQSEIGDADKDGCPEFIDGWGRPIFFLRWAPGFSSGQGIVPNPFSPPGPSELQTGNPVTDHDPFDTRNVDPSAFHLIPLIFSGGSRPTPDIDIGRNYAFNGQLFDNPDFMKIGTPIAGSGAAGNITNHHIEQR